MTSRWIAILRERHRLNTWTPVRRRLALGALLAATATGAFLVVMGGNASATTMWMYLGMALLALFYPAGITVQVILGQLLIAGLMLGRDPMDPLMLMPAMAGVIVTAELLAVVARLDTPIECEAGDVARVVTRSAVIGTAAFGVVAMTGVLPGPTGMIAVGLAAGACLFVAMRLVRQA